jgi:hypothetical protein
MIPVIVIVTVTGVKVSIVVPVIGIAIVLPVIIGTGSDYLTVAAV